MTTCENCGAIQRRDPGIFRDTAVCEQCGWWVHIAPGAGATVTALLVSFLIGMFGQRFSEQVEVNLSQA